MCTVKRDVRREKIVINTLTKYKEKMYVIEFIVQTL